MPIAHAGGIESTARRCGQENLCYDIHMPKPSTKLDDPAQLKRFVDLATEFEANAPSEELARAVKKIAPHHREKPSKKPAKRA